jgi:hypothetical protein
VEATLPKAPGGGLEGYLQFHLTLLPPADRLDIFAKDFNIEPNPAPEGYSSLTYRILKVTVRGRSAYFDETDPGACTVLLSESENFMNIAVIAVLLGLLLGTSVAHRLSKASRGLVRELRQATLLTARKIEWANV